MPALVALSGPWARNRLPLVALPIMRPGPPTLVTTTSLPLWAGAALLSFSFVMGVAGSSGARGPHRVNAALRVPSRVSARNCETAAAACRADAADPERVEAITAVNAVGRAVGGVDRVVTCLRVDRDLLVGRACTVPHRVVASTGGAGPRWRPPVKRGHRTAAASLCEQASGRYRVLGRLYDLGINAAVRRRWYSLIRDRDVVGSAPRRIGDSDRRAERPHLGWSEAMNGTTRTTSATSATPSSSSSSLGDRDFAGSEVAAALVLPPRRSGVPDTS